MAQQQQQQQDQHASDDQGQQDRGLVSRIGPVEIDWPRTIGYYGGIGLAVALEILEPPVAIFIAAIPFVKMFNQPKAPKAVRTVSQVVQGTAIPVGGEAQSTIRIPTSSGQQTRDESKSQGKQRK